MKILKNDTDGLKLVIDYKITKSIKEFDKSDIDSILNNLYEKPDFYDFDVDEIIEAEKNEIYKVIGEQLISGLKDFATNVDNIKTKIESDFPEIVEDAKLDGEEKAR
jgi:hypothetical protein